MDVKCREVDSQRNKLDRLEEELKSYEQQLRDTRVSKGRKSAASKNLVPCPCISAEYA